MLRAALLGCLLPSVAFAASQRPEPRDEIIVSSANYARSSRVEIQRAVNQPVDAENPVPPPAPDTPPKIQRYLFTRGEIATTDVSFDDLCRRLEPALARKGLVNAVNAHGRVPDPENLQLILRVSYGPALWRNPVIRTTDLTWKHGLIPNRRDTGFAAVMVWDQHAGGDDRAAGELAAAGGDDPGADSLGGEGDALTTDEYFLLVIDAFDYHDLRKHRHHSKRVWTTFISVPKQRAKTFSAIADAMVAKAAPYFGETTSGRMRFTHDRASVRVGELQVVDDDVPATPAPPARKP